MSADLAALASTPEAAALLVAVVAFAIKDVLSSALKELVGRFFRRSEKREDKQESLFAQLLDQVTGVRHALEIMGERLTNHQASASETKARVSDHDERISALETGQVELRTRVEYLSSTTGGKDD